MHANDPAPTRADRSFLAAWHFDDEAFARFQQGVKSGALTPTSALFAGIIEAPGPGDVVRLGPEEFEEATQRGRQALQEGAVAHVIVAGGMASRFRQDGIAVVKAVVPVVGDKSFLQLKIEDARHAGATIAVMTSFSTHGAIVAHCRARGLEHPQLHYFPQSITLRLRPDGEIFLAQPGKPLPADAYATPGHGDVFTALRTSGVLSRLRSGGVRVIMISNVDNLGATVDPALIGTFVRLRERGVHMAAETVERLPADGKAVGVVVRADGTLRILEGFRIPDAVDQDALREASINTFYFDAAAIDRDLPLPMFVVRKDIDGRPALQGEKITCEVSGAVDDNGQPLLSFAAVRVDRDSAPLGARRPTLLAGRFHPVKTPDDLRSIQTLLADTANDDQTSEQTADQTADLLPGAAQVFAAAFGTPAGMRAFLAPGRINIIGEHTDYNDGWVLPAAVDRGVVVVAAPTTDGVVEVHSLDAREVARFAVTQADPKTAGWARYVHAVFCALAQRGHTAGGLQMVLRSSLPQGGGMSSSSALCLAVARAACAFSGIELTGAELALLGQRAEHLTGVNCGLMDQWAVVHGRRDQAVLFDCRSRATEYVPLNLGSYVFVVTDTNKQRGLVDSEYNKRRQECAAAAAAIGHASGRQVNSLRDVTEADLQAHGSRLPALLLRRARHVVEENARVQLAAAALSSTPPNLNALGQLLDESHASLRDRFEVSCVELDTLVGLLRAQPGVLGARMMGGGFGGCTLALVRQDCLDAVRTAVDVGYRRATGLIPLFWVVRAADGLREIAMPPAGPALSGRET